MLQGSKISGSTQRQQNNNTTVPGTERINTFRININIIFHENNAVISVTYKPQGHKKAFGTRQGQTECKFNIRGLICIQNQTLLFLKDLLKGLKQLLSIT